MKTIAILSGKGGAGKTTVTASLASVLSEKNSIICADCDVDAANLALFFGIKEKDYAVWKNLSAAQIVQFDYEKCAGCGRCAKYCYFGAISLKNKRPELKPFSCEGCGACLIACPNNAIKLKKINNAKIGCAQTKYGFKVVTAQLKMGQSGSGKVVAEVKNLADKTADGADILLLDSAAGTGCPVIASVNGSDYCVLVAEPSPSGFFDMQKAYAITRHFKIKTGIIINKFDLNSKYCRKIKDFAAKNKLQILGQLGFEKIYVDSLINMVPVVEKSEKINQTFKSISEKIIKAL